MGVTPGTGGKSFAEIIAAAQAGEIKALLIHDDNPLLSAPGTADILAALEAVEALVVIDSVRSTTAEHADVVLAELPFFSKDGTITNADRHVNRQRPAGVTRREERDGVTILTQLANALGGNFAFETPADVMDEAAARVAGYRPYARILSGKTRALAERAAQRAAAHARHR